MITRQVNENKFIQNKDLINIITIGRPAFSVRSCEERIFHVKAFLPRHWAVFPDESPLACPFVSLSGRFSVKAEF